MFPPKKKPQPGMGEESGGLPAPRPFEAKDEPEGTNEEAPGGMSDESAETPQYEEQEEGGADLLADVESVGKRYGADRETSHALAADFFDAISKCLRGGKSPLGSEGADAVDATVDTYE